MPKRVAILAIDDTTSAPITETYAGTMDLDAVFTAVLNAHGPRLHAGKFRAEYWCVRDTRWVCRIGVNCNWANQDEKLGLLAFSFGPIPCVSPDEIFWIADVDFADVCPGPTPEATPAGLLIVSYRKDGIYPVVFPYTVDANGAITYGEPIRHDVVIPDGFVHLALRSIFGNDHAEDDKAYEGRHIAAAIASAYGHDVVFPGEIELTTMVAIDAPLDGAEPADHNDAPDPLAVPEG